MTREGFRIDWDFSKRDHLQFQGDVYDGDAGQQTPISSFTPPILRLERGDADLSGGNLLARWQRVLSETSDIALLAYYDNTFRRELNFHERRNTWDVDFQHHVRLPWDHDLVWGIEYRHTGDRTGGVSTIAFRPQDRGDDLFTSFVQDEFPLGDQVRVTLGTKLEHNDYSGFEVQPSGRIMWTPEARQSVWAAVSRAVRTPSRVEHDLTLTAADPLTNTFVRLFGDEAFVSEKVIAYELGHRMQVLPQLFIDTALFYNDYDDLETFEPKAPFTETDDAGTRTVRPFFFRNKLHGETYGFEVSADAAVTDWWRLHGAYSFVKIELRRDPGSLDPGHQVVEGSSPRNQVAIRSTMNLPHEVQFDGVLRYVDNLPAQRVGSYVTLDLRLAKQVTQSLELSVVGLNLAQDHHREFGGGTEVERSIYGQVRWRW
jgi:iron complex outermembrane receptor protein